MMMISYDDDDCFDNVDNDAYCAHGNNDDVCDRHGNDASNDDNDDWMTTYPLL